MRRCASNSYTIVSILSRNLRSLGAKRISIMKPTLNLYLDDSGTRNPDWKAWKHPHPWNWFALGGILINDEDESYARSKHAEFCTRWKIDYPLHSQDIRGETKNFAWLGDLERTQHNRFMEELTKLLVEVPVIGHACVIDRPGHDLRYRELYGRQSWSLCKTAFCVVVERAAKIAQKAGRRLRVLPEYSDPLSNKYIQSYYRDLKNKGLPFAADTSQKYEPLSQEQLNHILYTFRFKQKSSPMTQLADLYLYPMCRVAYDPAYRAYQALYDARKLIDAVLEENEIPYLGIKYSAFELVLNTKTEDEPRSCAASLTET